MDKVNQIMTVVKKHYFWVACGAIVVVALVCWWPATAESAKQYKDRAKVIDVQFANIKKIQDQHAFPNDKVAEGIGELTRKLVDDVYQAWGKLYQEQKGKNALPSNLSDDFKKYFKECERLGWKDELPDHLREHYQNFIKAHFPKLFDYIGVRKQVAKAEGDGGRGEGGGLTPGGGRQGPEMIGVVDWDEKDREKLVTQRFSWSRVPTTLQVRLAQEDLWVYEALLRIIKNINGDEIDHLKASIKRIEALDIGRDAATAWQQTQDRVFRLGTDANRPGGGGPAPTPGTRPGAEGAGGSALETQLLTWRYVDAEGKPLAADAKPPYAEFKMMPIRMKLVIDQQQIAPLLVECANSNMPIEVRAVRLQPDVSEPVDLTQLAAAAGGPSHEAGLGGGHPTAGRGRTAGGSGRPGEAGKDLSPDDVTLEVQGIIYIFNPPNEEEFKKRLAASEKTAAAPAETPPAAPAGTPPAAPAGTPPAGTPPAAPAGTPSPTPPAAPAGTPPAATPETPPAAPAGTPPATPPAAPAAAPAATPPAAPDAAAKPT